MTSNAYQMWFGFDGDSDMLRIPILPDKISATVGTLDTTVTIAGLGEVTVQQGAPAARISFDSFFPAHRFPGAPESLPDPLAAKDKLLHYKNIRKPIHFVLTGTNIDGYYTIENFVWHEEGGDVGTIHYSIKLREYREVRARKITLDTATQTAVVENTPTRTDSRVTPQTYTVATGDTLWGIAKRFLGNGTRYNEIYELNTDKIKNPNLIYTGMVLTLPA